MRWKPGLYAKTYHNGRLDTPWPRYDAAVGEIVAEVRAQTNSLERGNWLYLRFTEAEVRALLEPFERVRAHRAAQQHAALEAEYGPYVVAS